MQHTVNELLTMQRHLAARRGQLQSLAQENSKRITWANPQKVEEPLYDVKDLDTKIVKINKALFDIDRAIKKSNAVTQIEVEVDFNQLSEDIS